MIGAMSWLLVRRVLWVAVVVLVAAGCGSGPGLGIALSAMSRPAPTIPDATRLPIVIAPTEAPAAATPAPTTIPAATVAPGPATTAPATVSDDGGSSLWPWLLVALAVIAVVIAVVALRRRSPKAAAPSPGPAAAAAAVLSESDEITTHLVGLAPGGLSSVAGADANRLAALIATIEQLMTAAPDEVSRRSLAAVHDSMRSVHAALDAITLTPPPLSDADVVELRARATALHSATALARARLLPPAGSSR